MKSFYVSAFYGYGWQVGVVYKILSPRVLSFMRIAKSLCEEKGLWALPRFNDLCDPEFLS